MQQQGNPSKTGAIKQQTFNHVSYNNSKKHVRTKSDQLGYIMQHQLQPSSAQYSSALKNNFISYNNNNNNNQGKGVVVGYSNSPISTQMMAMLNTNNNVSPQPATIQNTKSKKTVDPYFNSQHQQSHHHLQSKSIALKPSLLEEDHFTNHHHHHYQDYNIHQSQQKEKNQYQQQPKNQTSGTSCSKMFKHFSNLNKTEFNKNDSKKPANSQRQQQQVQNTPNKRAFAQNKQLNVAKNENFVQASASSIQAKKYPTIVQSDLTSYIQKYKQRVAKAAAKATGSKVLSAANHIPTSIITAVAPSKKGHHKRSVSDGVAVLSAFHNDKIANKKQEQRKEQQAQIQYQIQHGQQSHPVPPRFQQNQQIEKKVKASQPRHSKHQSHTFAKSQEWNFFGHSNHTNQKIAISQTNTNTYNSPQKYHGGDSYQISVKYDNKNLNQEDQRLNRYSGNYSDLNALADLQRLDRQSYKNQQQQPIKKIYKGPLTREIPERCVTDQEERIVSQSMNSNEYLLSHFQGESNKKKFSNCQQQRFHQSEYQQMLQNAQHHERLMAMKRQNSALVSARKQQQWISPIEENDQIFYNQMVNQGKKKYIAQPQNQNIRSFPLTQQNSYDKKNFRQTKYQQSQHIKTQRAQNRAQQQSQNRHNIFQDQQQYQDCSINTNSQIIFSNNLSDPNAQKQFIIDDDGVDFSQDDNTLAVQQQLPNKRTIINPHSGDQGLNYGYPNENPLSYSKFNQKRYSTHLLTQDPTPPPSSSHISNYNNLNHLYNHSQQVKYQKSITPTSKVNEPCRWQSSNLQSKSIKQSLASGGVNKPGHKRHKSDITQTQLYNKYYQQSQKQQQKQIGEDRKNKVQMRGNKIGQQFEGGSTSDRNAINAKKQNFQMPSKRTHHYSQSITGAPGGYNPAAQIIMTDHVSPCAGVVQTVKKPESSLATSISKYQKFIGTNSGLSSSIPSHKQSPRPLKHCGYDIENATKDKCLDKNGIAKSPLSKMALKAQNKNSMTDQKNYNSKSANRGGSAFQRKYSQNQRKQAELKNTTKNIQNDQSEMKQVQSSKNYPNPSKSSSIAQRRPSSNSNQHQQAPAPRSQKILSPKNTPNKKRSVPSIDLQAVDENKNAMKIARLRKQKAHLFQNLSKEQATNNTIEASVNMDPLPSQMTLTSYKDSDNFTPRTAARLKLIKLIKLSFARKNQPPKTTCDFYRIGKVLGKGAFGKVNLAIHKLSQKMVAIKSINKNYLSQESSMKKKVMHQVNILKLMRHKNVVKLFETLQTNKHIVFVMELCSGGDLLNYVRKRRRLKENYGKFVFRQILQALQHCHSKNILHRDIKLDNVLLDAKGNVKLCDFGVSKLVKRGQKMCEQCGTPAYIAPQILRDQGYYGFSVDTWSAGVVLFAMLYGTVPFKANNMSDLHKLIINAKYTLKQDISSEAQDLIKGLLEKDPKKRLTIQQALSHSWFKDTPQSIDMFTEQQKLFIQRQFTYNDYRRHNRNINKQTETNQTDPFTEHHLESMNTGLDKNNTDKSVILAPFNSTMSGDQGIETMLKPSDSLKKVLIKGKIKFRARCREMDKQYEANNNADLDNGVYNKLGESEEQNEKKNNRSDAEYQTENQLPDGKNRKIIQQKKDNQKKKQNKKDERGGDFIAKNDSLVSELHQDAIASQAELQRLQSLADFDESMKEGEKFKSKLDERKNIDDGNLVIGKESLSYRLFVEMKYLREVQSWGFPREYTITSLQNNEINHSTTSYYLLAWSSNYSQNNNSSQSAPCHEEDKQ